MKEPKKIKLTDSPECKKVNLTPLPSLEDKYPETTKDDIYIKPKDNEIEFTLSRLFNSIPDNTNENNKQNDS
jgi:hypothetical protein